MINLLVGTTRALDCRCPSGVDDGIDAGVGYFLGVGRLTNGLRGCSIVHCIAASFDSSSTILNIMKRTCAKIEDESPVRLLIWRRLSSSLQNFFERRGELWRKRTHFSGCPTLAHRGQKDDGY